MGTGQSVGEGSEEEGIVPKATVMQVLKSRRELKKDHDIGFGHPFVQCQLCMEA